MSRFPSPASLPALNIPPSNATIKISVIDSGTRLGGLPSSLFFDPQIKGHKLLYGLSYSFLLEHEPSNSKLIFDLGISKDWMNTPPATTISVAKILVDSKWEIRVEKSISEVLTEHNVPLESINSVILSHWHWDHIGDPHLFPSTTSLTVGPGFKQAMTPGYPTNPESPIPERAYKDREFVEITFEGGLKLGQFRALDYFGDGSFYLLDSPGHAVGHLSGLARTTPDTFVFLGGDVCHHGGQMRPTEYLPLPELINPNPFDPAAAFPCPGSYFLEVHPNHSATEPFYHVSNGGGSIDPPEAQKSLEKLWDFDGYDNVFTIIAHDQTLLDVLEFFPTSLNDWKAKGLREKGIWQFLGDFKDAVETK
ncbi:hypothetical protein BDV93DRAFT_584809 [Ceratobasidium sp. AG-I]|nr:hypothetical protein BDV93DRAFT_584809 [Ceratobasidium sp. AG-I]